MKKLLGLFVLLLLGVGLGGGAAYGVSHLLGPPPDPRTLAKQPAQVETAFVPAGTVLVPVVAGDGRLSGYAQFDVQLEVPVDKSVEVTGRLPLLLHAINLRAWRTPMAAGPDHVLPDLRAFAALVTQAAHEALGKEAVVHVAVTGARPV